MSKNDKDRLVDKVMGEAVMTLLEADDDVSFDALIGQLQDNLKGELDHGRREAFRTAINGVHHFRTLPDEDEHSTTRVKLPKRDARLLPGTTQYKH